MSRTVDQTELNQHGVVTTSFSYRAWRLFWRIVFWLPMKIALAWLWFRFKVGIYTERDVEGMIAEAYRRGYHEGANGCDMTS